MHETHLAGGHRAKKQEVAEIVQGLPASEAQATRQGQLQASYASLGQPAYSWRELSCGIQGNDAGRMVQDYEQSCEVRAVDLIPVPRAGAGPCETLGSPEIGAPSYLTRVSRGTASALTSTSPGATYCPDGLTGPPQFGSPAGQDPHDRRQRPHRGPDPRDRTRRDAPAPARAADAPEMA